MTTTTTTAAAAIAAAALEYAALGWPPFPLNPVVAGRCGCIRAGCTDTGKHPVSAGWQRSIASPKAAASTWRPDAAVERGIGIALGPRAGAWVLDVDPAHSGTESLERLEAEHGRLPPTWEAATGGGGRHLYWAWPTDGGEELRNRHGVIAPGLDVKAAGGFAVAPPSRHASGERYRWVERTGGRPAPAPEWLLALARAPKERPRAAFARGADTATANGGGRELQLRAGERHAELVRFCGLLRSIGLGEAAIVKCGRALLEHHALDDDPVRPIDWAHAERTMRDVARRYQPDGWRTTGQRQRAPATSNLRKLDTRRMLETPAPTSAADFAAEWRQAMEEGQHDGAA